MVIENNINPWRKRQLAEPKVMTSRSESFIKRCLVGETLLSGGKMKYPCPSLPYGHIRRQRPSGMSSWTEALTAELCETLPSALRVMWSRDKPLTQRSREGVRASRCRDCSRSIYVAYLNFAPALVHIEPTRLSHPFVPDATRSMRRIIRSIHDSYSVQIAS